MVETYTKKEKSFELFKALRQTQILITKARQQELRECDTTTSQAAVLDCIANSNNRANPTQISKWLFLKAQSVSTLLNRMEKAGLVARSQDPDRKNAVRVVMTNKGKKIYSQVTERRSISQMFAFLSDEERKQLMSLLNKLQKAAGKQISESAYRELMEDINVQLR
jgi:DNA-binding MarR family transcriptional regulator